MSGPKCVKNANATECPVHVQWKRAGCVCQTSEWSATIWKIDSIVFHVCKLAIVKTQLIITRITFAVIAVDERATGNYHFSLTNTTHFRKVFSINKNSYSSDIFPTFTSIDIISNWNHTTQNTNHPAPRIWFIWNRRQVIAHGTLGLAFKEQAAVNAIHRRLVWTVVVLCAADGAIDHRK